MSSKRVFKKSTDKGEQDANPTGEADRKPLPTSSVPTSIASSSLPSSSSTSLRPQQSRADESPTSPDEKEQQPIAARRRTKQSQSAVSSSSTSTKKLTQRENDDNDDEESEMISRLTIGGASASKSLPGSSFRGMMGSHIHRQLEEEEEKKEEEEEEEEDDDQEEDDDDEIDYGDDQLTQSSTDEYMPHMTGISPSVSQNIATLTGLHMQAPEERLFSRFMLESYRRHVESTSSDLSQSQNTSEAIPLHSISEEDESDEENYDDLPWFDCIGPTAEASIFAGIPRSLDSVDFAHERSSPPQRVENDKATISATIVAAASPPSSSSCWILEKAFRSQEIDNETIDRLQKNGDLEKEHVLLSKHKLKELHSKLFGTLCYDKATAAAPLNQNGEAIVAKVFNPIVGMDPERLQSKLEELTASTNTSPSFSMLYSTLLQEDLEESTGEWILGDTFSSGRLNPERYGISRILHGASNGAKQFLFLDGSHFKFGKYASYEEVVKHIFCSWFRDLDVLGAIAPNVCAVTKINNTRDLYMSQFLWQDHPDKYNDFAQLAHEACLLSTGPRLLDSVTLNEVTTSGKIPLATLSVPTFAARSLRSKDISLWEENDDNAGGVKFKSHGNSDDDDDHDLSSSSIPKSKTNRDSKNGGSSARDGDVNDQASDADSYSDDSDDQQGPEVDPTFLITVRQLISFVTHNNNNNDNDRKTETATPDPPAPSIVDSDSSSPVSLKCFFPEVTVYSWDNAFDEVWQKHNIRLASTVSHMDAFKEKESKASSSSSSSAKQQDKSVMPQQQEETFSYGGFQDLTVMVTDISFIQPSATNDHGSWADDAVFPGAFRINNCSSSAAIPCSRQGHQLVIKEFYFDANHDLNPMDLVMSMLMGSATYNHIAGLIVGKRTLLVAYVVPFISSDNSKAYASNMANTVGLSRADYVAICPDLYIEMCIERVINSALHPFWSSTTPPPLSASSSSFSFLPFTLKTVTSLLAAEMSINVDEHGKSKAPLDHSIIATRLRECVQHNIINAVRSVAYDPLIGCIGNKRIEMGDDGQVAYKEENDDGDATLAELDKTQSISDRLKEILQSGPPTREDLLQEDDDGKLLHEYSELIKDPKGFEFIPRPWFRPSYVRINMSHVPHSVLAEDMNVEIYGRVFDPRSITSRSWSKLVQISKTLMPFENYAHYDHHWLAELSSRYSELLQTDPWHYNVTPPANLCLSLIKRRHGHKPETICGLVSMTKAYGIQLVVFNRSGI